MKIMFRFKFNLILNLLVCLFAEAHNLATKVGQIIQLITTHDEIRWVVFHIPVSSDQRSIHAIYLIRCPWISWTQRTNESRNNLCHGGCIFPPFACLFLNQLFVFQLDNLKIHG